MKVTNYASFPIVAFGWHVQHGISMDVTIKPGVTGEVSGPYLGEMGGGDCFIHFEGELRCHEGEDSDSEFHIGQGKPISFGHKGESGITVRHHLDAAEPHVTAWREENYDWLIEGYDTFDGQPYPLQGAYDCRLNAERAADARLRELEKSQPTSNSGGQGELSIQDQVFVVRPDGSKYRYTGNPCPIGSR